MALQAGRIREKILLLRRRIKGYRRFEVSWRNADD